MAQEFIKKIFLRLLSYIIFSYEATSFEILIIKKMQKKKKRG